MTGHPQDRDEALRKFNALPIETRREVVRLILDALRRRSAPVGSRQPPRGPVVCEACGIAWPCPLVESITHYWTSKDETDRTERGPREIPTCMRPDCNRVGPHWPEDDHPAGDVR